MKPKQPNGQPIENVDETLIEIQKILKASADNTTLDNLNVQMGGLSLLLAGINYHAENGGQLEDDELIAMDEYLHKLRKNIKQIDDVVAEIRILAFHGIKQEEPVHA
jgi:hypothetical protein